MEERYTNSEEKIIYYDWLLPLEAFEVLNTQWELVLESLNTLESEGVIW